MRISTPLVRKVVRPSVYAGLCALLWLVAASRASAQTEQVEYYALDAIGSVRVVFNASGGIVGRMDYAPFGQELIASTGKQQNIYAGLFKEGEAGLDYAQARMYQGRTGRMNAADPIYAALLDPQQWNRYSYALNSPLNFVDPDGEQTTCPPGSYYCVTPQCPPNTICRTVTENNPFAGQPTAPLPGTGPGHPTGPTTPPGAGGGAGGVAGGDSTGGGDGEPTPEPEPPGGPSAPEVCLATAANLSAGFGDMLTSLFGLTDLFGLPSGTEAVRGALGWDTVTPSSGGYRAGQKAGEVWGIAAGAAGTAARAGWTVSFNYYPKASGAGMNVLRNGQRRFAVDWNRFDWKGRSVNLPHFHAGATKSQMKKHRPYQGGWTWWKKKCK